MFAGTSAEAKENIQQFFINKSVPSPSPKDIIRARDERGNLILIEEINSDEKYEQIRKRYYTEHDTDLWKLWQYENTDLLRRERLSKQQPLISLSTFTKYKPNHVQQCGYLSQFGCATGIEFEWIHEAMMKTLCNNHHCGDPNKCDTYNATMGLKCVCDTCSH